MQAGKAMQPVPRQRMARQNRRSVAQVMSTVTSKLMDARQIRFIGGAVSIIVASSNEANQPELVRAQGCRPLRGGRLRLFLRDTQAATLIGDIGRCGRVAVVFTEPSSHRSVQFKGEDAELTTLSRGDVACVAAYRRALVAELERIGIAPALSLALLDGAAGRLVALDFTPSEAYEQTPGPDAGKPLRVAP